MSIRRFRPHQKTISSSCSSSRRRSSSRGSSRGSSRSSSRSSRRSSSRSTSTSSSSSSCCSSSSSSRISATSSRRVAAARKHGNGCVFREREACPSAKTQQVNKKYSRSSRKLCLAASSHTRHKATPGNNSMGIKEDEYDCPGKDPSYSSFWRHSKRVAVTGGYYHKDSIYSRQHHHVHLSTTGGFRRRC